MARKTNGSCGYGQEHAKAIGHAHELTFEMASAPSSSFAIPLSAIAAYLSPFK